MNNKKVYEIDTTDKNVEESVNAILKILKGENEDFKVGKIDWLEEFSDLIDIT